MKAIDSVWHDRAEYSRGCRCWKCKRANAEYQLKYMALFPGLNAQMLKQKRARKKERGECIDCPSPAREGCARCDVCLWKQHNCRARKSGRREISFKSYMRELRKK